ncbi:MAG: HAD family hydrolase [Myxococcota bacterium]
MSGLTLNDGADRAIDTLDITGDGAVNELDVSAFESLERAARDELVSRGEPNDISVFYEGPGQSNVFAGVVHRGDGFDLSGVEGSADLRTVAIEARWAAKQARLTGLKPAGAKTLKDIGARWFEGLGTERAEPASLCEMLSTLDASTFDAAKLERVAVFDLDKTIWKGSIIDPFLSVLIDDALITPVANERLAKFLMTVPGLDPDLVAANDAAANARLLKKHTTDPSLPPEQRISAKDGFFETVALVNGLTRSEATAAARKAIDKGALDTPGMRSLIFDAGGCNSAKLIEQLQTAGFEVYLLSATLDFLAFAAAEALGIPADKTIGSPLEVIDGKYTGNVVLSTYGMKGSIVRAWLPSPPFIVFGDSASSDVPMMRESFGASFMVNPGERMLKKDAELAGGRFLAVDYPGVIGNE